MRQQVLNFVIDLVTLVVMLGVSATGLLLRWILVPGSRGGRGLEFLGLGRRDWGDIHFWLSVALLVLVLVHVALHWTWVCALVARWTRRSSSQRPVVTPAKQWLYGVGFLVVCCLLVGGFLWMASALTTREGGEAAGARAGAWTEHTAVAHGHDIIQPDLRKQYLSDKGWRASPPTAPATMCATRLWYRQGRRWLCRTAARAERGEFRGLAYSWSAGTGAASQTWSQSSSVWSSPAAARSQVPAAVSSYSEGPSYQSGNEHVYVSQRPASALLRGISKTASSPSVCSTQ
jgi:hypothetical protein